MVKGYVMVDESTMSTVGVLRYTACGTEDEGCTVERWENRSCSFLWIFFPSDGTMSKATIACVRSVDIALLYPRMKYVRGRATCDWNFHERNDRFWLLAKLSGLEYHVKSPFPLVERVVSSVAGLDYQYFIGF